MKLGHCLSFQQTPKTHAKIPLRVTFLCIFTGNSRHQCCKLMDIYQCPMYCSCRILCSIMEIQSYCGKLNSMINFALRILTGVTCATPVFKFVVLSSIAPLQLGVKTWPWPPYCMQTTVKTVCFTISSQNTYKCLQNSRCPFL